MNVSRHVVIRSGLAFFLLLAVSPCHALATSRIGEIISVSGDRATINLGTADGMKKGLTGEIFREEITEGQLVTIRMATLEVERAYEDSSRITVRMRLTVVRNGDKVRVDDINRPPSLEPVGMRTVSEESPVSFTLSGSDPDGDELRYTASNLPSGSTLDPGTGAFTWQPGDDQSGSYTIRFGVTDGALTTYRDVPVTVLEGTGKSSGTWWWLAGVGGGTAAGVIIYLVSRGDGGKEPGTTLTLDVTFP
jgi:hypothetical protein